MNIKQWAGIFFLVLTIAIFVYFRISGDPNKLVFNVLYSFFFLLIAYLANEFIYAIIKRQVHDASERYVLKKTFSTIISFLLFAALVAVWVEETTSLVVAYGLLSAGIAIALQDILRNVAGGVIIFLTSPFKAGDRIQVDNDKGDVLDIRVFYTALMEIQEWIEGDQFTGRIIQIPNGFILNKTIKNYTKDFSFIWDEFQLMFTYDSNWKKAQDIVLKIAHEITSPFETSAKNELIKMGEKYFIRPSDVEEKIYTKITDNWIDMRLKYVVNPLERRHIKNLLNEKILEAIIQETDIKIASATYEIVGFPKIKIEK